MTKTERINQFAQIKELDSAKNQLILAYELISTCDNEAIGKAKANLVQALEQLNTVIDGLVKNESPTASTKKK